MKIVIVLAFSLIYLSSNIFAEENKEESKIESSSRAIFGVHYLFPNDANASFIGFDIGLRKVIDDYHFGFETSGFYGLNGADGLEFVSIRPSVGFNGYQTSDKKFNIFLLTSSGVAAGSKDKVNFYGTLSTIDIEFNYDIYTLIFRGNYLATSVINDAFPSLGFRMYLK